MKNIRVFCLKFFQFLEVHFPVYLNRCVFVMRWLRYTLTLWKEADQMAKIHLNSMEGGRSDG